MPHFVAVASTSDILPGQAKAYVVGDREIALFNIDGRFHAIENVCPHQGAPLADGWIDGHVVTCPWHAWCFDVRSGEMPGMLGLANVDVFDVQIDGSTISVSPEPRL